MSALSIRAASGPEAIVTPPSGRLRYSAVAVAHVIKGVMPILRRTYGNVPDEPIPDAFGPLMAKLAAGPLGRVQPVTNRTRPVLPIVTRAATIGTVAIAPPIEEPFARTKKVSTGRNVATRKRRAPEATVEKPGRVNAPTMVVVRVPLRDGLLMVRRAANDAVDQPALPGGYQRCGETWQEAGAREVFEGTGVKVEPWTLRLLSVVTPPDRRQNVIFCQSPPCEHTGAFARGAEVDEVLVPREPVATGLPLQTLMVADFFKDRLPRP